MWNWTLPAPFHWQVRIGGSSRQRTTCASIMSIWAAGWCLDILCFAGMSLRTSHQ
jgi:hypothetical protein